MKKLRSVMKKLRSVLYVVFLCVFLGGIILSLIGGSLCAFVDNGEYHRLQEELTLPDYIVCGFYAEEWDQIYVCYYDTQHVDVYNTAGEFLWAVEAPYLRRPWYAIQEDKLIIYYDTAYLYSAVDGTFLGTAEEEEMDLPSISETEPESPETYEPGKYYFEPYAVLRADENGDLQTVISRPWWHRAFYHGRNIPIALLAGFGIGILYLLDITKEYRQIRKNVKFKDSKARKVQKYHKFTVLLQSVYAVCNLLLSFWGGWLVVGIIPITLHFMVSYVVTANMDDRLQCNQEEWTAIEFWRAMGVVSFLVAFFFTVILSAVAV